MESSIAFLLKTVIDSSQGVVFMMPASSDRSNNPNDLKIIFVFIF